MSSTVPNPLGRGRLEVLADVLHELPIGVFIVDAQGRIREANAIAERVFGVGAAWRELKFAELKSGSMLTW